MKRLLLCLLPLMLLASCGAPSEKAVSEEAPQQQIENLPETATDTALDSMSQLTDTIAVTDTVEDTVAVAVRADSATIDKAIVDLFALAGQLAAIARQQAPQSSHTPSDDWRDWEEFDVEGIYEEMSFVYSEEDAGRVAEEDYDGEYIEAWGDYYARIDCPWGEYRITLGDNESSTLYRIAGTDKYINFRWSVSDVSTGDEGIIDISAFNISFYKRP
ncbi:MAG: hypothetical protein ACI31E_05020 [Muribaculaceae bacterium]